ncbi:flagellar protein FliT [Desulfobotulus mexicanus]|uniref:Flagellar protein FliT n=1 Tax=Desulfobotulus mexicanus TaxID=2586642 RepID=A0A5Q4VHG8_9BACT|nr:flagellar protein FliT [Desulfobotulus mexicanus]TYT76286.1 flagellar protein FliT [Desulfobotulus mexicanus]
MDFLPETLINSFDTYIRMQKNHLLNLEMPEPDMENMNFERSRNYADLEQELRNLLRQIQTPAFNDETREEMVTACNRRIRAIMDTDARITEKIRQHKEELSKKMQEIKRGKTAVSGYGAGIKGKTLVRLSG